MWIIYFWLTTFHCINTIHAQNCQTENCAVNVAALINYDLSEESDSLQLLINSAIESLNTNHMFSISNFLTPDAVELFRNSIISEDAKPALSNKYQTSWQDAGIDSSNTSRNFKLWSTQYFLGRSNLEEMSSPIINLYNYAPLLSFFRSIVMNANVNYSDLHLSHDKEGSVYGMYYQDGWHGHWHLDEHTFSCVWIVQRSLYGSGSFGFIDAIFDDNFDDDILWNIYHNDSKAWNEHVKYHFGNQGDVYCFNGNETFHTVNPIIGNVDRIAFITTFAETDDFQHKPAVHEYNIWRDDN